jgi:hypothetical protein
MFTSEPSRRGASRQLPHAQMRLEIALYAIGSRCGGSFRLASGGRRYFALLDLQIFGLVVIEALTASLSAWKCQVFSLAFPVAVPQCRRSVSCGRAVVSRTLGAVLNFSGGCGSWNRGLEATAMSVLRTMADLSRDIWRQREAWNRERNSNRRDGRWSNLRSHRRHRGAVNPVVSSSKRTLSMLKSGNRSGNSMDLRVSVDWTSLHDSTMT